MLVCENARDDSALHYSDSGCSASPILYSFPQRYESMYYSSSLGLGCLYNNSCACPRQLIFIGKVTASGVLCYFALLFV